MDVQNPMDAVTEKQAVPDHIAAAHDQAAKQSGQTDEMLNLAERGAKSAMADVERLQADREQIMTAYNHAIAQAHVRHSAYLAAVNAGREALDRPTVAGV